MPPVSTGCFACRRRKVKCDEGKPGCQNCGLKGEECPGYRGPGYVEFRSMDDTLALRYGSSEDEHKQPEAVQKRADNPHREVARMPAALNVRPQTDWKDRAAMHFFHQFLVPPTVDRCGYLDFLPEMLAKNSNHLPLTYSFAAVSLAHLANVSNLPYLSSMAQQYYGTALRYLAGTLNSPKDAMSTCGIVSVVLLQKYDVICGSKERFYDAHREGLEQLLNLRSQSDGQSYEPLPRSLAMMIDRQGQMNYLDGVKSPAEQDSNTFDLLPAVSQLWQIRCHALRVNLQIQQLLSLRGTFTELESTVVEVWHKALLAHASLQDWATSVPPELNYQEINSADAEERQSPFPPIHYKFGDYQQGSLWVMLWGTQILLIQAILELGNTFGLHTDEIPVVQLRDDLLTSINSICASAADMMGEIDDNGQRHPGRESQAAGAFFSFWGLAVVANELNGDFHLQRNWALDRLFHIGHAKGIKQALRTTGSRLVS